MRPNLLIAFAGFIGAVAPGLAQLSALARTDSFVWPSISFYVGTFIVGLLGMAVALFGKETIPWKAFMQGMGAPALFSSAGTAVVGTAMLIMPITYAQEPQNIDVGQRVIVVNSQQTSTAICGDTIELEWEGVPQSYVVPCTDGDTIRLNVRVSDPAIRRGLVQAIMPMSKAAEKFDKKLIVVEENKLSKGGAE